MCQKYKIIFIFFFISLGPVFSSDYHVLDKAYSISLSGGFGSKYLSNIEIILPTLVVDSEFIIIDSFGLSMTNSLFANNTEDFFFGDTVDLSVNIRPMFAIRFIQNKFSKNYYKDYFYNSISLNFGGIIEYTKFSRGNINKNITSVGTKLGLSFAFLMFYDENADYYLKTLINYNFIQDMIFFENIYNMNGLYIQFVFGVSFRFGDNINWLVGENENEEKIDIHFKY